MTLRQKSLWLTTIGIILMSFESPIMKLSKLGNFEISFLLGISIFVCTNFIMITKGKSFVIQSYTHEYKGVLFGGFCSAFANFFFALAVIHGGVANTVLILATSPIFAAFITKILFKQSSSKGLYVATIFIFIGLFITLHEDFKSASYLGTIFAFLCMGGMTCLFALLKYYPEASRIGYISTSGALLALVSLFFIPFEMNLYGAIYMVLVGLVSMPLARYLVGFGAKHIFPQEISLLMILESVLAPFFAWWWVGEELKVHTLLGGTIILVSLCAYFVFAKKSS